MPFASPSVCIVGTLVAAWVVIAVVTAFSFLDTYTSREYAVPDITKSSLIVNLPPAPNKLNLYEPPSPKTDPTFYAASDIIQMPNIQGVSGNNVYAVPNPDLLTRDDYSIMEFPRDHLKFIEKLGEGQFGEVSIFLRVMRILFYGVRRWFSRWYVRRLPVTWSKMMVFDGYHSSFTIYNWLVMGQGKCHSIRIVINL